MVITKSLFRYVVDICPVNDGIMYIIFRISLDFNDIFSLQLHSLLKLTQELHVACCVYRYPVYYHKITICPCIDIDIKTQIT